jgi:RND family efflux transporter MFP subunit
VKVLTSRFRIVAVVVVVGLAALALWLHEHSSSSRPTAVKLSQAPPVQTVGVVPVERRNLVKSLSLVAELRPWTVVNLYAKETGYLKDIYVDYGSVVADGETVATLELPEEQAQYDQAEAALRLARVDYDRILSVVHAEPGLIAAEDVDKAQAAYEEAKDARDQDAVLLSYANITAPFSGVVTKRYADPGALIQAGTSSGTQPVIQIADTYTLRLVVQVPEENVEKVQVGTPVDVKIQATGAMIQGRVARFSYDVHEDTRTMHTEVDVPNPNLALKPGMYAQASIALDRRNGIMALPVQAVSETTTQPNVWVVDAADRIRQRDVTTGLQTANWVEITSGLQVGDRVLVGDRSMLSIGQRVHPKEINPLEAA